MFRMPRDSFDRLCELIEAAVGRDTFKSELCISERVLPRTNDATSALGGFLSGQFKIAVMLRILAGASYLDLLQQYNISTASVYSFFHEGVQWVIKTFEFPLVKWLREENWEALNQVSDLFAEASGDVFKGCIGALDGLAIKIKCPTMSNMIPDPGNYFCRKGFYALNVQAICDKLRRITWVSTGQKGSTHDSTAFNDTKLNKEILQKMAQKLQEKGFFFIGDSAYPLLVYMLTPFADVVGMSPEDAFNYWLSNSRIQIECAFGKFCSLSLCIYFLLFQLIHLCILLTYHFFTGEIIMRWGIFWRKLQFDIVQAGDIIKAAMLLHNFIIDEREAKGFHEEDASFFREFSLREQDSRRNESAEIPSAVATDNNEPQ
jgi:hypothetical protein